MKYLIRSLKYFVYLLFLLALVIAVLLLSGLVEGDLSTMFVNGYDSYWQMALVAFALALIYPRMGYVTRKARIFGEPEELKERIDRTMEMRGYVLAPAKSGIDGKLRYVRSSTFARVMKLWEDTITIEICAAWVEVEGHAKDVVRVVTALEATQAD